MLEVETNQPGHINVLYKRFKVNKIARKLDIHWDTVKRRSDGYEKFKASPISDHHRPQSLLSQYVKTGSVYNVASRQKRKLSDDIITLINNRLIDLKPNGCIGMKQQLKKIDIHGLILKAGHVIGYSVVCDYIRTNVA